MTETLNKFSIEQVLISVSDKQDLELIGSALHQKRISILSSGGTATFLKNHDIYCTEVKDYTNHPEILGGRVKTLHPKIFGGILARDQNSEDQLDLQANQINKINLVIVNLYPFTSKLEQNPQISLEEIIEFIDVGGPSLIRAAAKNFQNTIIITDRADYQTIIDKLTASSDNTIEFSKAERLKLAYKAFKHTAEYDAAISEYFAAQTNDLGAVDVSSSLSTHRALSAVSRDLGSTPEFRGKCSWVQAAESRELEAIPQQPLDTNNDILSTSLNIHLAKTSNLRYGENPDQQAAVYSFINTKKSSNLISSLAEPNLLQGKELSYNNLLDANAAINIIRSLSACDDLNNLNNCVIIKHNSPCGIASSDQSLTDAYHKAFNSDSRSAFGGIIAINKPLTAELADTIISNQFLEVIIAPNIDSEALEILRNKPNIRVIHYDSINTPNTPQLQFRTINGGMLIQNSISNNFEFNIVTKNKEFVAEQKLNLLLSWYAVQHVKSNAIVLAKNLQTIGIGGGQTSRIGSLELAAHLAKVNDHDIQNSVLASDAFFPFPDSIDLAKKLGINAIIQPGGSKNDAAVIEAANKHNLIMVFTNYRKFCH